MKSLENPLGEDPAVPETAGFCAFCGREHRLSGLQALEPARELMEQLEQNGRIDFTLPPEQADPRCSLAPLFGEGRGQMFGVLVCRDYEGKRRVLKAFSGQYGGLWEVEGWVPPVLDARAFWELTGEPDRQIKAMGRAIALLGGEPSRREELGALIAQRKALSKRLMKEIHKLYVLTNFRGETRALFSFFPRGIPAGTGDCCAPKLLHQAALLSLVPISLGEFFWGRENASRTRQHGHFYSPCREKCGPLMGFLLCGSGEQK